MIIENICQGSKATTYHTFKITTEGMNINFSSGVYSQNGKILAQSDVSFAVSIPTSTKDFFYAVHITNDGISVETQDLSDYAVIDIPNFIDTLAWLTVPANTSTLDNIDVHVRYVNAVDGGA